MRSALRCGLVLLLLAGCTESGGKGMTADEVLELRALGFTDEQIQDELRRTDTELSAADLERLEASGVRTGDAGRAPDEPAVETPQPARASRGAPGLEQQIVAAYGAPAAVIQHATTYSGLAAEAALYVSRQAGGQQLVTSGTLTQLAPNTMQYRYSAGPSDRIHVVLADGKTVDYVISEMRGNLSSDSGNFFSNDHAFAVRVIAPDEMDLSFTSRKQRRSNIAFDGGIRATAKGSFVFDGKQATCDVSAEGTWYFENDFGGFESKSDTHYTGTLSCGGTDFVLDEQWNHVMVSASGRVLGRTRQKTVSNNVRTVKTTWRAGGSSYAFRDVVVLTAFINGAPATNDARYWKAHGAILRDGAVVATPSLDSDGYRFVLAAAAPAGPIELQHWLIRK